jgi:D-alanine-D-alanine ligase
MPKRLKTALTFNLKRVDPSSGDDTDAEFDRLPTLEALASALEKSDLAVELCEAGPELLARLSAGGFDFAFNIAEGRRGRSREAQVPAILEFLGIPYSGSDPTALGIAHDKALAKRLVASFGLGTAPFAVLSSPGEPLPEALRYPLFLKPAHEGTSKGISPQSICQTPAEARRTVEALLERYQQPVLVEEFLTGREFTVGIVGNDPPRVLPIMEFVYEPGLPPIYDFDVKIERRFGVSYPCPAPLDPALEREISALALGSFRALGCRDVSRVDIRLDRDGRPCFIEVNPLPGLTPGFSDLVTVAKAGGLEYEALVAAIAGAALRRAGLR